MGELFQDSEFTDACQELDEPQVEGWEYFTESHGLKIYRQLNKVSEKKWMNEDPPLDNSHQL